MPEFSAWFKFPTLYGFLLRMWPLGGCKVIIATYLVSSLPFFQEYFLFEKNLRLYKFTFSYLWSCISPAIREKITLAEVSVDWSFLSLSNSGELVSDCLACVTGRYFFQSRSCSLASWVLFVLTLRPLAGVCVVCTTYSV